MVEYGEGVIDWIDMATLRKIKSPRPKQPDKKKAGAQKNATWISQRKEKT
jgi:hypothetical protein